MYRTMRNRLPGMGVVLTVLLVSTALVQAATPAELLEKAIYTEETVGDLDAAIKLYEQVIAEGKSAQAAAAQAQYRLAMIYQKQGKQEEATAAFEKLIKEFPDQEDLIAKARKHLPRTPELLPAPWSDGEALQLNMKLASGLDIGTSIYRVDSAEHEGEPAWKCSSRILVTINRAQSVSWVLCERESFAPIASYWQHTLLGTAKAVYGPDQIEVTMLPDETSRTIKINGPVFDNEQGAELFRRLPLAVGYKTSIPIISTLGAGLIALEVEVPEKETVEVPAGKFECFKLVLNIGQEFWVSDDENRYLVRFAAGGVTADLAKVWQGKTGQAHQVQGDHYSLTLPDGWYTYSPAASSDEEKTEEKTTVYLVDPDAIGVAELTIGPTASLPEDQRTSPRAWTEAVLERFKPALKDFQLRGDGIEEHQVAGLPSATFVADFTDDGKKSVMYGVGVMRKEHAATLRVTAPAEGFDEYRKQLDEIVSSLKLQ